jgi:hypothetical protein
MISPLAGFFRFRSLFFTVGVFLFLPQVVFGWGDWQTLKTDHFMVLYKPGHEWQAWEALKALEQWRPMVQKLTGNNDPPFTAVAIQDGGAYANGFTDPLDGNIHLFTYPPSALELPNENWWALLGTHEYTHMLHLNRRFGVPGALTDILGNVLNPNILLPAWLDEGFAVYSESKISPTTGRLNDGFFDSYLLTAAGEGRFPSLLKTNFVPSEYPLDIYYGAGAGFHEYLAKTYGDEKFEKFYQDYGTNVLSYLSPLLPCLGIDAAAEKSFGGKPIQELWDDWEKSEKERGAGFASEGEQLTHEGWDLSSVEIEQGHLYYQRVTQDKTGFYSSFRFHKIVERDLVSGKEREVLSTTAALTAPLRIHEGKLYYSTQELKEGFDNSLSYGYVSLLHERDLATGRDSVLLVGPFRGFEALPDGRILYSVDRQEGFGSDLFALDPKTRERKLLFHSDFLVDEIRAGSGRLIVTAKKEWGSYNLCSLDLETKKLVPLFPGAFLERNPQLVGNKLIFNANFEKRYSLYEYDFSSKKVARLTREGYAAWPAVDVERGLLYFAGLNAKGFDLHRKKRKPEPYRLPPDKISRPPLYSLLEKDVRRGDYFDNLGWMAPKFVHAPLYYFNSNRSWLGVGLLGTDALYHFSYSALPIYDFTDHQFTGNFILTNFFFAPWVSAVEYLGIGDNTLFVQTDYPLVARLSSGMSQLHLGSTLELRDDFSRAILHPFVAASFSYPTTRWGASLVVPLERTSWGSAVSRTGAYGNLSLLQYLPGSQLRLSGLYLKDPQNGGTVFPVIRGYGNGLAGKEGLAVSASYTFPLLKIHWGLWNPSFYFEDLVFKIFTDGAGDNLGNTQWSYGAELHLETALTNASTGLPNDFGLRFTRNQEGATTFEGFFDLFSFNVGLFDQRPLAAEHWRRSEGMPHLDEIRQFVDHPGNPLF